MSTSILVVGVLSCHVDLHRRLDFSLPFLPKPSEHKVDVELVPELECS